MKLPVAVALTYLFVQANLAPTRNYGENVGEPANKRIKRISESRCELFFSEVKLASQTESDVTPFIELQSSCQKRPGPLPKTAISNYMMIMIKSDPLALAMVVSFANFPHDGTHPFIVVGAPDVENVQVSASTPHIQSIFSRTDPSRMFPTFDSNLFAFFLLKDVSKSEAKSFNLQFNQDGIMVARVLTSDQIKLITMTAVDMLVLGTNNLPQTSDFEYMWSAKTKEKPMLSDSFVQIKTAEVGMSLSKCKDEYNGFDSGVFEVKPMSPGERNLCVISMEVIDEDVNTLVQSSESDVNQRSLLHSISEDTLSEIKTSTFNPNWITRCQSNFPKRSKLLEQDNIQKWIYFKEDNSCRFTCKPCQLYRSIGFRPDIKSKPNIVTTGFLSKDVHDNGYAIKAHLQYPMHVESAQFFEKLKNSASESDVHKIIQDFEDMEIKTFNATMNVALITYAEIKAGISFQIHEILMKAVTRTGANVGRIHHTSDGAQSIAKSIAKSFRYKMLKHFVTQDTRFSIMVDSSTNFNMPFLAVYVQTIEDNYPVTHFYSLIYMADGEKSRDMTNSFIDQIKRDDLLVPGFEEYFKSKVVAFSSDGASVMVGGKTSFQVFISEYVKRTIPNVVCLAHKLDSAYKLGIKPDKTTLAELDNKNPSDQIKIWQFSYFQDFEKSSNELYSFYASRGYKKWNHLVTTAEELGIFPKRFKYVYNIRWSESHFRALETVHHNYYAIVEDLDQCRVDKGTDESSRRTAEQHYLRMTDKTYLIVLHEFLDILSTFKMASKQLQESSSIIVGKIEIIYDVIKTMQEYQTGLGLWLKDFLQNCACGEICYGGDCTTDLYDDCTEVSINGVKLVNNFPIALTYSSVRSELYDNLIMAIKKYFNLEMLEAFQIFNPTRINFQMKPDKLLPPKIEDFYSDDPTVQDHIVHQTAESRLEFVCGFYGIIDRDCQQLQLQWSDFLSCVITSESSALDRPEEATRFWPWAITVCPTSLTPLTKKVLEFVMVTPFSSSQVERGFSVMNAIKTKSRPSLDKDTLDELMAVKINGPDIPDFNVYEYTIAFLKQHARVDDAGMRGGRKPAEEKFPSMFKKSRIY